MESSQFFFRGSLVAEGPIPQEHPTTEASQESPSAETSKMEVHPQTGLISTRGPRPGSL